MFAAGRYSATAALFAAAACRHADQTISSRFPVRPVSAPLGAYAFLLVVERSAFAASLLIVLVGVPSN